MTRLEITLGQPLLPHAELLDWELEVDGVRVAPAGALIKTRAWSGRFSPGQHTVGMRVLYKRDLKTVVSPLSGDRVGFTFVTGDPRWVGNESSIEVQPASVLRLAATLDDNPRGISDRLLVALEQRAAPRTRPEAEGWRGDYDLARLVQEKASWVTTLLSPQLVRAAGRGGEARVKVAVDSRGYLQTVALQNSTGSEVLDHSVGALLRLAEPYPAFEGELTVTLSFDADPTGGMESGAPSPSALTKLPAYLRQR